MAKANAKADPKALASYPVLSPIKTVDGMLMPGDEIECTAREAAELGAAGVIQLPEPIAPIALDAPALS